MHFRQASRSDIPAVQRIRRLVRENVLTSTVTDEMCREMIEQLGKGWVCEVHGEVVGFSVADNSTRNIWALFVDPLHEGKGIGKVLLERMVDWLFLQNKEPIWLTTEPGTRAEKVYRAAGWRQCAIEPNGEIRFELTETRNKLE